LFVHMDMKLKYSILLTEMVHALIVPINTYAKKIVNHVFKNHLLHILRFIVGAIKIQCYLVNSLKVLKQHVSLIVMYAIANFILEHIMF